MDEPGTLADVDLPVVGMNAYLGADAILPALDAGADVVIGGRFADPSMFLAPLMHRFGWDAADMARLGAGTLVGHLMECGMQVTGGYYADSGSKDVADLARCGFPIAEVAADGGAVITKLSGTGGEVTSGTVKEQLLYEVHDPARYLTPDLALDFSAIRFEQVGTNRVRVSGARSHGVPPTLKVAGFVERPGFIADAEIGFAGTRAHARAERAAEALRLRLSAWRDDDIAIDLVGVNSILRAGSPAMRAPPPELRVHVSARCADADAAQQIEDEVYALTLSGPAGGCSVRSEKRSRIEVVDGLIDAARVPTSIEWASA
jgi:Acyclic terpene utilisation family protein AtuA